MLIRTMVPLTVFEIRQFINQVFDNITEVLFFKKESLINEVSEIEVELSGRISQLQEENSNLKNKLSSKMILLDRNLKLKGILELKIKDLNLEFFEKKNLLNTLKRYDSKAINEIVDTDFFAMHSGLVSKLTNVNRRLTSNNLKLCILVYKKMSTKEISRVLVSTPSTVKVAKFRLRKKLGIDNSKKTLVSFLHAL